MKRNIILVGFCAVLCITACQSHKEEHGSETKFLVTNPVKKDTSITKDYVCQVHSSQHIEMRALERGYLENIYVDEGQFVKKGQLMFQIMPRLYEAQLKKAQAEASYAQIEYENTKQLAEKNVVAPNELALAKAKLDKAKAEVLLEQVHLDFTKVKAPFDGIMDHFHVRLGSLVEEGELLTTLSDNHEMWVYFNVPEAEYLDYKSKVRKDSVANARLLMANNKLFDHVGKVTTIEADFNNETGNIAFRATFPNPDGLLRHGETGNILIETPLPNALLIPQKATFEVLDKKYVFVVDENDILRSREIKIGAELTHLYEVKRGLRETDNILLEGLRKVKEGQKIVYEFLEPEGAISQLHQLHAE
ncbi:Putative Co/Zn/Cd efflux system membrane fusion protein [Fulvivirga imtechensis AK7]|uniref:Putative Co/Zn/Cd efflux system membrane fusion protein n=1 Tax=Fulvivirga imtechensis AK7 TaxID=1237149 RepID=L8JW51_9BACT|nr:efflux RND transporter periplasmic adaptor subunit [Fulvivirga imtechensis]ELR73030.1 Putative Co/Zn/Cd efflux system membrane fusion protein [Fulvivirga imtechensis AK7]